MGISNTESTNTKYWKDSKYKISSFNMPIYSIDPPPPFIQYAPINFRESLMLKLKYHPPFKYKKEIQKLFTEFAQEDIELAEMGMEEYNDILLNEDKE